MSINIPKILKWFPELDFKKNGVIDCYLHKSPEEDDGRQLKVVIDLEFNKMYADSCWNRASQAPLCVTIPRSKDRAIMVSKFLRWLDTNEAYQLSSKWEITKVTNYEELYNEIVRLKLL